MKSFLKVCCNMMLVCALLIQTAFAAGTVTMYGQSNGKSEDVTVLVLNKTVDLENVKAEDVKYINQYPIGDDGSFSLELPLLFDEDLAFYSNMSFEIFTDENEKKTVYVSSSGSDTNDGTENAPLKTLSAAYKQIFAVDEIVLMDSITYEEPPAHSDMLTIKGKTSDVVLNLPSEISLKGELTLDNLTLNGASTIYANGNKFKVKETVLSAAAVGNTNEGNDRVTVYGGKKSAEYIGDTEIILLGGRYKTVYGGGNGGKVTGNTNVVLGGNVNNGDVINDANKTEISPCYVYGGGNNGSVTGKTNVTLKDSAVTKYIVGAGSGANGTAVDTNIFIDGGKVMNVYGGSANAALSGCNTHITMTGGLAEALFGGNQSKQLTGNTYITLVGGEVSRRVYSGCYNEWDIGVSTIISGGTWSSDCYVTGTTTIAVYPEMKLNTTTELASDNSVNVGVFSGSRTKTQHDSEVNTIIYLNNCYETHSQYIGEKSSKLGIRLSNWLKSFEDYTVKAGLGGEVLGTNTGGVIKIMPDNGYYGLIGDAVYESGDTASIGSTATVTFSKKDFFIYSLDATKGESKVTGNADINADNSSANETDPTLFVAVFDTESGQMLDVFSENATSGSKSFNLDCTLEQSKTYTVKAMLWNGKSKPLTSAYVIEIK